ncbi:hypothetical protein LHJ74_15065 [Streptomyces sp. N2-109]|uniref:Uncharacterized protein n=1 Tax=Streptomyces gossypii TaxID=2883101 RepID=A0ABT2JTJ2_9ACTN|nr:hypothetical protein [Streptomyces gossypii]MCT2591212.1 hypothetical protein [Streptomyces gossypii]
MANGHACDVVGTADHDENAADRALTALCWWRTDLPQGVCEDYWRDVHGIMFARTPGGPVIRYYSRCAWMLPCPPGARSSAWPLPPGSQR